MPGAFCHRPSVCSGVVGVVEILKFNVCVRHGIKPAKYQDLGDILKLQLLAYKSEWQIYDDFRIPPPLQTEEEIKTEFSEKLFLKAIDEHGIIGSFRCLFSNGTCFIERLPS